MASKERYSEIVSIVSKRLKLIQRFEANSSVLVDPWRPAICKRQAAAELYESIDAFREAVNCYIAGEARHGA